MLLRLYDGAVKAAVVLAFTVMLGAALLGTVSRHATFMPIISWSEEVTRFAGIWAVFLVAGLGIRQGAHLGVDIVTRQLPAPARRLVALLVHALVLAFAALLLVYGLRLAHDNMVQLSPALEWPMGAVYLCMPIGAALIIGEVAGLLWRSRRASA